MVVRRLLFSMGYRYRLHRKDLPGTPDIVFIGRKKAIYVNGCFWHLHGCKRGQLPKSRIEYWKPKLEKNAERDRANIEQLKSLGWDVLVVWQCETTTIEELTDRLKSFLD